MPALPLDEAGKYVAGAYVVFLALLLIYVAIMATRLQRIDRELGELAEIAESKQDQLARSSDEVAVAEADPADPPGARPAESGRIGAGPDHQSPAAPSEHLGGGVS